MSDTHRITRRSLLLAAGAVPLAACSQFNTQYGDFGHLLAETLYLEGKPGITREQAAAIPYASLGYRIGNSGESMLILASDTSGDLLWTSSARHALMTRSGRIMRSAGFEWNLAGTSFNGADPLAADPRRLDGRSAERLIDLQDVQRLSLQIASRFESTGPAEIEILGTKLATVSAVEHCRCDQLSWEFDNSYWVDAETGFVWRSEQTIHPNLPAIEFEVFRPPA